MGWCLWRFGRSKWSEIIPRSMSSNFHGIWSRVKCNTILESHFITKWFQIQPFRTRPREPSLLFLMPTYSNNDLKTKRTNTTKRSSIPGGWMPDRVSSSAAPRGGLYFQKMTPNKIFSRTDEKPAFVVKMAIFVMPFHGNKQIWPILVFFILL